MALTTEPTDLLLDLVPQAESTDRTALGVLRYFARYVDFATGAIGRVVGSEREPAGSQVFYIWASDNARDLDVGHIVVTASEDAVVIGVVDEPRRYSDLRTFLDDYFDRHLEDALDLEQQTRRPEILVFAVNVLATRHLRDDVDSHRPPVGGPVYFATPNAIEYALDTENFTGATIPALLHTNGNAKRDEHGAPVLNDDGDIVFQTSPIWLDEDYLLGPEAGHANWTGQSGLATKTSHALFLTSAVFQRLRSEGKSVAALMFNVKGPDLLWLDKPAVPEEGMEGAYAAADCADLGEADLAAYRALGIEPKPFTNLKIFAPFKAAQQPMEATVSLPAMHYHARLNTMRDAATETHCVFPVLWELGPLLYLPHKIFERDDLDDKLFGFVSEIREERGITTFAQLEALFAEIDVHFSTPDENGKLPDTWRGHHQFTIRKARNRFKNLTSKFGGLLAYGSVGFGSLPQYDAPFADQEVRVVDIAGCNTNVQETARDQVDRRRLAPGRAGGARRRQGDHLRRRAQQVRRRRFPGRPPRYPGRHRRPRSPPQRGPLRRPAVPLQGRRRDPRQLRHLVLRPGRRRGDHQRLLPLAQRHDQVGTARPQKGPAPGPPCPFPRPHPRLLSETADDQGHGRAGRFQHGCRHRGRRHPPRRRALLLDAPPHGRPGTEQVRGPFPD